MSTTIYDDVFRTIVEKYPQLCLPLINEVFLTEYPPDEKITQLRNEFQDADGERITDSRLRIRDKVYHIECQSRPDGTMSVRLIEYDFKIAMDGARVGQYESWMSFPQSCVLYLRHNKNTPTCLTVHLTLPDGQKVDYRAPIVRVQDIGKDELFSKKLLALLPFYILRYEDQKEKLRENAKAMEQMILEYRDILGRLENEIGETRRVLFMDLIDLMKRIVDHVFRDDGLVRERLGDVMGGKVLELESERLLRVGKAEGRAEGEIKGKSDTIISLVKQGLLSAQEGAKQLSISVPEMNAML